MGKDKMVVGKVCFGPSRGGGQITSGQRGYAGDPPCELEYAVKGTTAELATDKARLAEARELLLKWRHVTYKSMIPLQDETDAFLTSTQPSDKVLVRLTDLSLLWKMAYMSGGVRSLPGATVDRLRIILGEEVA